MLLFLCLIKGFFVKLFFFLIFGGVNFVWYDCSFAGWIYCFFIFFMSILFGILKFSIVLIDIFFVESILFNFIVCGIVFGNSFKMKSFWYSGVLTVFLIILYL